MAVPKNRHTKSRRNTKRSHHALSRISFTACTKCGKLRLPHNICENCGTYKGREYIDVLAKLTRREKKAKEKEISGQEKEAKPQGPLSMEDLSKK